MRTDGLLRRSSPPRSPLASSVRRGVRIRSPTPDLRIVASRHRADQAGAVLLAAGECRLRLSDVTATVNPVEDCATRHGGRRLGTSRPARRIRLVRPQSRARLAASRWVSAGRGRTLNLAANCIEGAWGLCPLEGPCCRVRERWTQTPRGDREWFLLAGRLLRGMQSRRLASCAIRFAG
jgi:hypothetical protein